MKKIEKKRPQVVEEPLDIIEEVNSIDFSCSSKSSNLREMSLKGGHPDHPETWGQNITFSPSRHSVRTIPEEFNSNPIPSQAQNMALSPNIRNSAPFMKKKTEARVIQQSPSNSNLSKKAKVSEKIFVKNTILNSTIVPQ